MKKIFSFRNITVFLLAIIIALSSALIITNNKLQNSKSSLAEQNVASWNSLFVLTKQAQSISKDSKDELGKFACYQNGVIYGVSFNLYPHYTLEGYGLSHFLTTYDQFLKDIKNSDLSEEEYKDALDLYIEVGKELTELCSFVLNYCEENKIALLNSESKQSKEINKKIKALTEEYEPKIYGIF